MKTKRILALILSAVMILSLAACDFGGADDTVYWLNFKPELADTLQELGQLYHDKTGVNVRIETPEVGEYRRVLREEMKSEDPPTLFIINDQYVSFHDALLSYLNYSLM